jgi:putative membrane protein
MFVACKQLRAASVDPQASGTVERRLLGVGCQAADPAFEDFNMTIRALIAAVAICALGLASPAVAQDTAPSAGPSQDYVNNAAVGNLFEVQSSKLALQKSSDAKLKSFASRMIKDHTANTATMKRIIRAEELPLAAPTRLDDAHQQLIDSLSGASGGEFDHLYLEMQMQAHQEALALHQSYAQSGLEPKLRAFAKKTSEVVQMHLGMLKGQHSM